MVKFFTLPVGTYVTKFCQFRFDKLEDRNDRFGDVSNKKLYTIKNIHAVINFLKYVRCIKWNKATPGLDRNYSQLEVLEKKTNRS